MKIKNEGDKEAIWWVGKLIVCDACKREVELEITDKNNSKLRFTNDSVLYTCETCNSEASIKNCFTSKPTLITETVPQPESTIVESKADETTVQIAPPDLHKSTSAHVGPSKVTEGWANPFAGTSWAGKPPTSFGR